MRRIILPRRITPLSPKRSIDDERSDLRLLQLATESALASASCIPAKLHSWERLLMYFRTLKYLFLLHRRYTHVLNILNLLLPFMKEIV